MMMPINVMHQQISLEKIKDAVLKAGDGRKYILMNPDTFEDIQYIPGAVHYAQPGDIPMLFGKPVARCEFINPGYVEII